MTPKERLIERLRALCRAHGGPDEVAMEIDASAENLKQILAGTKLPTGQPRGVGPNLQRKLEARFPGWADEPAAPSAGAGSPQAQHLAAALDAITDPRMHASAYLAALEALESFASRKRSASGH